MYTVCSTFDNKIPDAVPKQPISLADYPSHMTLFLQVITGSYKAFQV